MIERTFAGLTFQAVSPSLYRMKGYLVSVALDQNGCWYVYVNDQTDKSLPYFSMEDAAACILYACRSAIPCSEVVHIT